MRNAVLCAAIDGEVVTEKKCLRLSPGEMEQLKIPVELFHSGVEKIIVTVEGGDLND